MRRTFLESLVLAASLFVLGCVPPPAEQSPSRRYDEETGMGRAQEAGRLRIGVPSDHPPLARWRAGSGRVVGLSVWLGRELASTLEVTPEFVSGSTTRLLELLGRGDLDVAFPSVPLTESRVRAHPFSNPYLLVHQRLLVDQSSAAESLADLAGEAVCSYIDPATGVEAARLAEVAVVTADRPQECMRRFARNEVSGITADDVYLDYIRARLGGRPTRIVGDSLTTAGYGVAVETETGGWLPFVNAVLSEIESDGRWRRAYERWVSERDPPAPPELSAEESAALYPTSD
jgi:polar amino acid transport system substrate-binding protein